MLIRLATKNDLQRINALRAQVSERMPPHGRISSIPAFRRPSLVSFK